MFSGLGEGIAAIAILVVVMVTVNKMLGTSLPNLNFFRPDPTPGPSDPITEDPFSHLPGHVPPGGPLGGPLDQLYQDIFEKVLHAHPDWTWAQIDAETRAQEKRRLHDPASRGGP